MNFMESNHTNLINYEFTIKGKIFQSLYLDGKET